MVSTEVCKLVCIKPRHACVQRLTQKRPLARTFWQGVEVLLHEALNPLQIELDQHVVELRALIVPHVNNVLQVRDGQLLKALPQEVQHLVSGQSLHLCQVLCEDLDKRPLKIQSVLWY